MLSESSDMKERLKPYTDAISLYLDSKNEIPLEARKKVLHYMIDNNCCHLSEDVRLKDMTRISCDSNMFLNDIYDKLVEANLFGESSMKYTGFVVFLTHHKYYNVYNLPFLNIHKSAVNLRDSNGKKHRCTNTIYYYSRTKELYNQVRELLAVKNKINNKNNGGCSNQPIDGIGFCDLEYKKISNSLELDPDLIKLKDAIIDLEKDIELERAYLHNFIEDYGVSEPNILDDVLKESIE